MDKKAQRVFPEGQIFRNLIKEIQTQEKAEVFIGPVSRDEKCLVAEHEVADKSAGKKYGARDHIREKTAAAFVGRAKCKIDQRDGADDRNDIQDKRRQGDPVVCAGLVKEKDIHAKDRKQIRQIPFEAGIFFG